MVRAMAMIQVGEGFSPIPIAIGLFVTVSLLVSLCARHARKFTSKTSDPNMAKPPLPSPKQLITTISQKARKTSGQQVSNNKLSGDEESGVWQKAILMGEKCQPPEFSGVIYYDYSGNRIPEMPKSPRAGSMTPLRSFMERKESSLY